EDFGEADARAEWTEGRGTPRDLSLYFHIPFCESLCWFCGCTTVITLNHNHGTRYIEYLGREMTLAGPLLNAADRVVQLHWGGGTPTFLAPREIRALGTMIRDRFRMAPDMEASVEIDPRRLTPDHVAA